MIRSSVLMRSLPTVLGAILLLVTSHSIAFDDASSFLALSADCQSCHDGVIAPDIRMTHPIGIDYRWAQLRSRGKLKDISQLDPGIALEDGRIGCLTCHQRESRFQAKLIMSNAGSALCFSCHRT